MNMQKLEFFSVHRFFCDIIVEYANVCVFIYMQRICQFFHRIFMIFFCCNFVHRIFMIFLFIEFSLSIYVYVHIVYV